MKVVCERPGCGVKFEKVVPWKIYCSKECKYVVWSLKKLEAKKKLTADTKVVK